MGFAVATLETQPRNHGAFLTNVTPPLVPSVTLSIAFSDLVPDPVDVLTWQFAVVRSGNRASDISVAWAVAPGGSPMPASTFVGGVYPSGTVTIPAGQTSGTAGFQTAAGLRPSVDQFATLALLNPSGCNLGTPVVATLRLPGQPIPVQDQLGVTCPDTSWPVDAASHAHTVTVVRTNSLGTYLAGTQVTVALTGTGANPIVAADISGGLLNSTVTFAAGETSRAFTVTTLPGAAPASDKTGRVAVTAPVGGQLAASGTFVDVAIPHSVVGPPTGVLPPQYTDPNWTGMTAYALTGGASPGWADLQAACVALSGKAACKTTFIELPVGFDFGTATRALPYRGYVDAAGKIYPLTIRSVLANIGDRTKIAGLAHFRHIDLNNAVWVWLYGLAAEFPITGSGAGNQYQADTSAAVEMSGSTDCLVTRCWLDAPQGVYSTDAIRPRVGACDFYGTVRKFNPNDWFTQFRLHQNGPTWAQQNRTLRGWFYQNYLAQLRAQWTGLLNGDPASQCGAFYSGDGVPPSNTINPAIDYPNVPYDLNCRETWFFNNLVYSPINFLIYNKGALNIWRNRVISTDTFNEADTGNPQGSAFHYIAVRGGNCTMAPEPASNPAHSDFTCSIKYNSCDGKSGHNDIQCWHFTAEFNDWGGIPINLFMACDRHDPLHPKTLLAASYARFRGNTGGEYQLCSSRNGAYEYQGPLVDCSWEGEDVGTKWVWETSVGGTNFVTYSLSGQNVAWQAGKNKDRLDVTFHGDTKKLACAAGQLSKADTTSAVRQLTTASKNADYIGEFTAGRKGIVAKDANCLVWDYVGTGAGGGGGGGGSYDLISANWATHLPVDNTDYAVSWLAGGGVELRAGDTANELVGLRLWCKSAEPAGAVAFAFHVTRLDSWAASEGGPAGIFALFVHRYLGTSSGYPASPADWPAAKYQGQGGGIIDCSDDIYRPVGKGYRHSFANAAQAVDDSFQFRLRTYNGVTPGDNTTIAPTSPNPIPSGGTSFLFTTGRKYRLEVTRSGNAITAVKTDTTAVSPEATQTWTFSDPLIGGLGAGGYCGFAVYRGSHVKIEPVAGVPFCQAA